MLGNLTSRTVVIGLFCLSLNGAKAEPTDNWVQDYVIQFLWGPEQNLGQAGVYLGKGVVISAAHVAGANTRGVRIDGLTLPAKFVKAGKFPQLDLALISIDPEKLPMSLRERRMPLCEKQAPVGAPVIVGALEGVVHSTIAPPLVLPPGVEYSSLITEGTTDGKSGSGVFDAEKKCLLGILSQKIVNTVEHKDIATYFVPASKIQSFLQAAPRNVR